MSDTSRGETGGAAAREAQDAIVSRPGGSKSGDLAEAMRRYLAAETYDQLHRHHAKKSEGKSPRTDQR